MRKIEAAMIQAIKSGVSWRSGNSEVTSSTCSDGVTVISVYLHGKLIAQRGALGWGIRLAGWNTSTTRSRLDAIAGAVSGGHVYCRAGQPRLRLGSTDAVMPLDGWVFLT